MDFQHNVPIASRFYLFYFFFVLFLLHKFGGREKKIYEKITKSRWNKSLHLQSQAEFIRTDSTYKKKMWSKKFFFNKNHRDIGTLCSTCTGKIQCEFLREKNNIEAYIIFPTSMLNSNMRLINTITSSICL